MGKRTLKLLALPFLAFALFAAYSHSLPLGQSMLPAVSSVGVGLFIAAVGVLAAGMATLWAIVFALPFAWLYRRRAAAAALVCVAPLLIVTGARAFERPPASLLAWLPTVFFFATLLLIVPAAAHLAHRAIDRRSVRPASM